VVTYNSLLKNLNRYSAYSGRGIMVCNVHQVCRCEITHVRSAFLQMGEMTSE